MKNILCAVLIMLAAGLYSEILPLLASTRIAAAGTQIELKIQGMENARFAWSDGGSGGTFDSDSGKVKWTAPAAAPKNNPVVIKATGANPEDSGSITIAVLGGPIETQTLVVFCDGPGPVKIFKGAPNQLKDTKYKWVMAKGDDLALTNDDLYAPAMKVKGKKTSPVPDNNEIKLVYTVLFANETRSCEAQKKVTVYQPCGLKEIDRKLKQEFGPDVYGYSLAVTYQLMDQFEKPLSVEGIHVEEQLKMQKNPLRFPQDDFRFKMEGFNTDAEGKFYYGMTVVKSSPLPDNFEVQVLQELKIKIGAKDVPGCLVRRNELSYKRESGDIKEVKEEK